MAPTYAPDIAWPVARRVGLWAGGTLPEATRPEAIQEVASLRRAAREAGQLVAKQFGPEGLDHEVVVVDRDGWHRAAESMVDGFVAAMGLTPPPTRPWTGARRSALGVMTGVGLGVAGRQLLGQYDPVGQRLYLVAPTIMATRRHHGIDAADFHLWVCLHEQTHAAQFGAAPWLRDHLVGQLAQVANGAKLDESVALMTFLEGHADLITDRAAQGRIAAIRALRAAFRRRVGPRRRGILGAIDKSAQYRDGLAFCRAVTKRKRQALNAAFESPVNLPTLDEIAEPPAWLSRVHG